MTGTGCAGWQVAVLSVPAIGAMARISGSSQAIRQLIIAPFDMPVAKMRRASMLAWRSTLTITSRMKPTSSTLFFCAAAQHAPAFHVAMTPLGQRL